MKTTGSGYYRGLDPNSTRIKEGYVNGSTDQMTSLDYTWITIAIIVGIIDLVLMIYATIFTLQCQKSGNIPTWIAVFLLLLIWLPTPMQPIATIGMAIYGGIGGCKKSIS
ncbi:MAG: hypothetical protein JKX76_01760 [Colwellia sp.]|nr:hypothetical protein [Colwellia sp.]